MDRPLNLAAACLLALLALLALSIAASDALAQNVAATEDPAVLLLMDSSKSMGKDAGDGQTRMEASQAAVGDVVGALPPKAAVGLRVYGGRVSDTSRKRGCRDTALRAPVEAGGGGAVISGVQALEPTGFTPIGRSLRKSVADFPADAERKTLILISDGGDNCAPPPPCKEAAAVAKQGVELTIQVIGLQVSERARRQLRCIAAAGGGTYVDAGDPEALTEELRAAFARARRTYQPTGAPVEGSAEPKDAPVVTSGQYLDALAPGTTKWYAIKVGRKQRLFTSAVPIPPDGARGSAGFSVMLLNSTNEEVDSTGTLFETGQSDSGNVEASAIRGEYVAVGESPRFRDPGIYRVGVELEQGQLETDPVPLELFLEVLDPGQVPSRALEPVATNDPPGPKPGGDAARPAPVAATATSSSGILLALIIGGAALTGGLLAGFRLQRRARS